VEIRSLLGLAVQKNVEVATLADVAFRRGAEETGKDLRGERQNQGAPLRPGAESPVHRGRLGVRWKRSAGCPVLSARFAGQGATDEQNIALSSMS
jgi:hypothetical protein